MLIKIKHSSWITFCITTLISSSIWAYSPLTSLPQGAHSGLFVQQLGSSNILQQTGDMHTFFPPASTLKLVTALAAKLELGDNYLFETDLLKSNNDIIIQFSGDPTLTNANLKSLLLNLKQQGITQINGDLWLDNSAFTGYERGVGWPWDITGVCYSAPSSAITLDHNCVHASIYTQANGTTRVHVPEQFPITTSTQAKTVDPQQKRDQHCDLELIASNQNHYQFDGCVINRKEPMPLKFAVQNPELYASNLLSQQLKQTGIHLVGKIKIGTPTNTTRTLLARHTSAPLSVLIETMLKKSDNLIADNLTKTLGRHVFYQSGSFSSGIKAIKQIILSRTGINLERAQLVDGSGLSRNNRMTMHHMSQILDYIWRHEAQLRLMAAMPRSGQSGTLQYRKSMQKEPIKGNIIAKSGSIYGSYNMAGFGLDQAGQPRTLFVQFVTNYFPDNKANTTSPLAQFETQFYQDIIRFSQINQ